MKAIKLTKGFHAIVDDEDFEFLNRFTWCASECGNHFYAVSHYHYNGKKYKVYMHRFIMMINEKSIIVDHRNQNTLDNRRENLRICDKIENHWNSKSRKNSVSQYLGVSKHRAGGWVAQITKERKYHYLGYFKEESEAAIAYNNKAIELFGEFANINIITDEQAN